MLGMALVGSLLICTSGLGGLAGHLLGVSRAGGPLARRVAGLRSTGSAFRGPAVHPSLNVLKCYYANEGQARLTTVRATPPLFG